MSNYNDTLQRGDKIGCYRIEEVLGRGGFAVTYLATDENLDVEIAIKEYLPREITQRDENLQVSPRKPEFAEDYTVGLESFAREAKTLARFKHPHIVRVHQVLHANNTAYMVMDFEQGQELAEVLEMHETLPEEELRAILFPILDGVEEIHRHGFVHRDIKPSNIYIRHNGSPVLIDFGAARYTMSETTQQLTAVVTVGYTPIEQYNVSEDSQGPWSDIYALAAVCYEAVTGDVPTDSVTRASASVTKGNDPLPSVRTNAKQRYSDDCLDAIDWGLRMDAEDRPQVTAQWRDSFDGIFNPAAAYTATGDASIYSPTAARSVRRQESARDQEDEITSIPLNQNEMPMDADVVSLTTDTERHSDIGRITTAPNRTPNRTTEPPAEYPTVNEQTSGLTSEIPTRDHNSGHIPAGIEQSSGDKTRRNMLRRDSAQPDTQSGGAPMHASELHEQPNQSPEPPKRKRSKLERPTHVLPNPKAKRSLEELREDIQFDESDWDYEPPKPPSAWRLLIPALGLAGIVGAAVLLVNSPDTITNLLNRDSGLTTSQAIDVAEQKMGSMEYLFPDGESALDYYNKALDSDPGNAEAMAGISKLEDAVREEIAFNMKNNNLSEANRLLARADQVGLTGIYGTQDASSSAPTNNSQAPEPVAVVESSNPTSETVVTPVDTASIQPQAPGTAIKTPITSTTLAPEDTAPVQITRTIPTPEVNKPNTGIDNNLSPYALEQIERVELLVEQQQFDSARAVFDNIDKFIADPSVSRRLQLKIEAGEAQAAAAATVASISPQPPEPQPQPTPTSQNSSTQTNTNSQPAPEPAVTPVVVTTQPEPAVEEPAVVVRPEPSGNVFVGSSSGLLTQLQAALENKSMDDIVAISEPFPEARAQFLNRMVKAYDRIDVTIDDVNDNGDNVSAKLNVSMFNRREDGSFYSAGKWNDVILNMTRDNGVWQKISW